MGLKEASSTPEFKGCIGFWGCMISVGIIFLVFGTINGDIQQQEHLDTAASNSIDCVITAVDQGSECDWQRDGCFEDTDTTTGRRRLLRTSRGGGGPICDDGWNYKYWYYYDYLVTFQANNICDNDQLIENGYHNQSLITFNFTSTNECQNPVIYDVGDKICYDVDKQCVDTTFELDHPSMDKDVRIETMIIAGAILLTVGGCCCCITIGWYKYT